MRSLGIERFEIDSGSAFFAPAGSITTTEYMSDDIDGYFCHFSDDFLATGNNQLNIHPHTNLFDILKRPLQEVPPSSMETILFLLNRILEIYKHTNNLNLIRKYLIIGMIIAAILITIGYRASKKEGLSDRGKYNRVLVYYIIGFGLVAYLIPWFLWS